MSNFDFKVRKIREDDKAEFMAMSRDFYSSDAVLYPCLLYTSDAADE